MNSPITTQYERESIIKRLPTNKNPGPDGFTGEMYKTLKRKEPFQTHSTRPGSPWSQSQTMTGTFLVVQWLRLWVHNAGGLGLVRSQGTRSFVVQLRSHMMQLKKKKKGSKVSHLRPGAAKMNNNNKYRQRHQKKKKTIGQCYWWM